MRVFAYRFGFMTPAQERSNLEHGWDDECSATFLVRAPTAEAAFEWGKVMADLFVAALWEREGATRATRWSDQQFAAWVEPTEGSNERPIAVVEHGVMPDPGEVRTWR